MQEELVQMSETHLLNVLKRRRNGPRTTITVVVFALKAVLRSGNIWIPKLLSCVLSSIFLLEEAIRK